MLDPQHTCSGNACWHTAVVSTGIQQVLVKLFAGEVQWTKSCISLSIVAVDLPGTCWLCLDLVVGQILGDEGSDGQAFGRR